MLSQQLVGLFRSDLYGLVDRLLVDIHGTVGDEADVDGHLAAVHAYGNIQVLDALRGDDGVYVIEGGIVDRPYNVLILHVIIYEASLPLAGPLPRAALS